MNEIEAEALVAYLVEQIAEGTGELALRSGRGTPVTVGIISLLGMEQTRVLRRILLRSVTDAQLARHKIVVGDPASFQGDEQDHSFPFSLTLTAPHHPRIAPYPPLPHSGPSHARQPRSPSRTPSTHDEPRLAHS